MWMNLGVAMKMRLTVSLVATMVAHMAGVVLADVVPYQPVANIVEAWSTNDAKWKAEPLDAPKAYLNKSLVIKFNALVNAPPYPDLQGGVYADGAASAGMFVGNFINSAVDKVAFDVMKAGAINGATRVRLTCQDGTTFDQQFQLPSVTGVFMHVEVPLWYSSAWGGVDPDTFSNKLSTVTKVSVINDGRTETAAGSIYIDNFKLVGPWEKGPITADDMPVYWLQQNGFTNAVTGHADGDADRDGMSNHDEYIAGTNPQDSNSMFRIEIASDDNGKPVVKWKHVDYRKFTVFESSDLTGESNGFQVVESQISSKAAGNAWVAADENGSEFKAFKVEIDKQ
jgi:hypothetical protein